MKTGYDLRLGRNAHLALSEKSVLITGASGLIGANLALYLDWLCRTFGTKINLTLQSKSGFFPFLNHIFTHPPSFVSADLTQIERIGELGEFDFIFQLAGYGQPGKFMADPIGTMILNSQATQRLRGLANERFLFAGTSEVYSGYVGPSPTELNVGNTSSLHPRAPYIVSKLYGEVITNLRLSEFSNVGNTARISLAYGPGVRLSDQRVMSDFINMGINSEQVSMADSGSRERSYLYVSDAVELLTGIAIEGSGGIYNVGGTSNVTIRTLGQLIAEKLGVSFLAGEDSGVDSSPQSVSISMTKTLELLGDFEFIPLEYGLDRAIEWHRGLHESG